jgi:phage anti-repressor protein
LQSIGYTITPILQNSNNSNMSANIIPAIDISKAMLTIKDFIRETNISIDNIYIDKFWENIADDKWIYIGSVMLEWIGYQPTRDRQAKEQYLKMISSHFAESTDYKHLYSTDAKQFYVVLTRDIALPSDFNSHNKAKHLFLSPDCFKESLMLMQTPRSKEIRKYYIQLEKVFKEYLRYQSDYQASQTAQIASELEIEKNRNTLLMASAIDYNRHDKKEYLYIATNARYASQNNFKIGKTQDLKQRLSAYNTSHNKREPYYYTFVSGPLFDAKTVEHIIKHILVKFRNSETNELYVIEYEFLEKMVKRICQNYDASVDYYNELISASPLHSSANDASSMVDISNTPDLKQKPDDSNEAELKPVMEYFADNKEYRFTRFKSDDGRDHFKCMRCGHTCTRIDAFTSHFVHRKVKCWNNPKQARIAAIKENEANPIILYYLDNQEYPYFESIIDNTIVYNCNRCDYQTDSHPALKRHFDRATKCWKTVKRQTIQVPESEIKLLDGIPDHKFVERKNDNGEDTVVCYHCQYNAPTRARLRRHFNSKRKCWL